MREGSAADDVDLFHGTYAVVAVLKHLPD
jgi:hypothetical protein